MTARSIGVLLIDGFAMMSYASVVEPFRAANVLAGADLYEWRTIALNSDWITASNGARLSADFRASDMPQFDLLFVFELVDLSADCFGDVVAIR